MAHAADQSPSPYLPPLALRQGAWCFDAGEFFACHEILEPLWQSACEPERGALHALIHAAVALHHAQRGNANGWTRQARAFELRMGKCVLTQYAGIDLARLRADFARLRAQFEDASGAGLAGLTPPKLEITGWKPVEVAPEALRALHGK